MANLYTIIFITILYVLHYIHIYVMYSNKVFCKRTNENHIKQNVNLEELKEIFYLVVDLLLPFFPSFYKCDGLQGAADKKA